MKWIKFIWKCEFIIFLNFNRKRRKVYAYFESSGQSCCHSNQMTRNEKCCHKPSTSYHWIAFTWQLHETNVYLFRFSETTKIRHMCLVSSMHVYLSFLRYCVSVAGLNYSTFCSIVQIYTTPMMSVNVKRCVFVVGRLFFTCRCFFRSFFFSFAWLLFRIW